MGKGRGEGGREGETDGRREGGREGGREGEREREMPPVGAPPSGEVAVARDGCFPLPPLPILLQLFSCVVRRKERNKETLFLRPTSLRLRFHGFAFQRHD